jgi:drug/metabolite transporter (DMT)-like permease
MFLQPPPQALILVCAVLWSLAGVMIKSVDMTGLSIAGMRSLVAALALALLFPDLRKPPSASQFLGAISYTLTVISFVVATKLTTAANAIFLQSTAPLYVFIFSWLFLKHRPKFLDFLAMPFIGVGMTMFFIGDLNWSNKAGILVGAASGLFFGSFLVLMRRAPSGSPLRSILWGNILTFCIAAPFINASDLSYQNLGMLCLMGLFQLALPYYIYSRAVGHLSALDASLILLLEPILNPIWVWIFIGEQPNPNSLIGGAIVISSVAARAILKSRKSFQR